MQRISELDGVINELRDKNADLRNDNHSLRNELVKAKAKIADIEMGLVELEKRGYYRENY